MQHNRLFERAVYPFGGSYIEKLFLNKFYPWVKVDYNLYPFVFFVFILILLVTPKEIINYDKNFNKNKSYVSKKIDEKQTFPYKSKIQSSKVTPLNYVKSLQLAYPHVNFSDVKTSRDVSRIFFQKNNFISLASEMEGFRGDLHKDPATGLNIGFGYNITKKLGTNDLIVKRDLLSLGLPLLEVEHIIAIAQLPQNQLESGIEMFYKFHPHPNNQIISLKQGVSLLFAKQAEYSDYARNAFPKSFDKMAKNQKEVLTYSAYKAGQGSLQKFKTAINRSNKLYENKSTPNLRELQTVANELNFYYKKDGKKKVLDKRASLIAKTFVHQDYLGNHVGANNTMHSNEYLDNTVKVKSTSVNKLIVVSKK